MHPVGGGPCGGGDSGGLYVNHGCQGPVPDTTVHQRPQARGVRDMAGFGALLSCEADRHLCVAVPPRLNLALLHPDGRLGLTIEAPRSKVSSGAYVFR